MNSSDKDFEKRARAHYHEAAQRIDPATAGRLRAARRTALEAATAQASPHHRARVLVPVGALAAMALAALMIWQPTPRPQDNSAQQVNVASTAAPEQDAEVLPPGADKTDPGLYQNLDFYSWLAANQNGGSSQPKN
jgi:ferric-dicitrate binding protein FerR (iron transport regulator)